MTEKQFVGEVKWLGESPKGGTLGDGGSHVYGLVAYKGNKTLKQWGMTYTEDAGWGNMPDAYTCANWLVKHLKDHWKDAVALGADRLCAYIPAFSNCPPIICYDGKTFTQSAPTSNKPTITCPPGQAPVQHPDGSWYCEKAGMVPTPPEFVGSGCPPEQMCKRPDGSWGCRNLSTGKCETVIPGGTISIGCPPGQHYSAPLKKCVPTKQPKRSSQQYGPQRGMTQGVEEVSNNEYSLLRKRGEVGASGSTQFVGELRWSGRPTQSCPPGYVYSSRHNECRKAGTKGTLHGADPFSWIGNLGATPCEDMESQLQALGMKVASQQKNVDDLTSEVAKAKTAWETCYSSTVPIACVFTGATQDACIKEVIAQCESKTGYEYLKGQLAGAKHNLQILKGQIIELQAKIKNCPSGGGGGGGPECSPTKPCPEGKECCQQGWTQGDFGGAQPGCTPGTCVNKCPSGYTRSSTGVCQAVAPAGGGKSSSGLGLLLLGTGAVGAIFLAVKAPKLPPRAADAGRLQQNAKKRRKQRRR